MVEDRWSDAALLAAGDPEAFGAFYARHRAAVVAYFARRVADREAVADLTAECFAAALLGSGRFDPARGEPTAWLFGIAAHQLARYRRRGAVERRARERLGVAPVALTDPELRQVLDGADDLLAALPDDQRAAVAARVLDDRDYVDIATELGVSEPVVRKRVSRGLSTLRGRLRASGALPAVAAALAVAAGLALAILPAGDEAQRSATRTQTTADAGLARQAEVVAALRRPQTAADTSGAGRRAAQMLARMTRVRGAGVRVLGPTRDGGELVLVPVARFSALGAVRRGGPTVPTSIADGFCVVVARPDGGGTSCWDEAAIRSGAAHGWQGGIAYGLVPDGVASVRLARGGARVPVRDGFFTAPRARHDYGRPLWFDAAGRRIRTGARAGHRGAPGVPVGTDLPVTRVGGVQSPLADVLGSKPAVVVFSASFCAPCRAMEPIVRRMAAQVPLVVVAANERPEGIAALRRIYGDRATVVEDRRGRVADAFGGHALPTTVVVDPRTGVITSRRGTFTDATAARLVRAAAG